MSITNALTIAIMVTVTIQMNIVIPILSAAEPHNKHSTSKNTKIFYCATVLPGNNHQLLLDALGRRPWWRTSEDKGAASFDLWWGGNGQPFDWAGGGIRNLEQEVDMVENLVLHWF